MSLPDFPRSPDPNRALEVAWPDIVKALDTKETGFKKEHLHLEREQAFERAVAVLASAFGDPDGMARAVTGGAALPDEIDRQHLMHFVGRWRQREETAKRIMRERGGIADDGKRIMHGGGRNARTLTPAESDVLRERRKKAKE